MGNSTQSVSLNELQDLMQQCGSLHEDWQRFYALAAQSSGQPDTGHLGFIQLQSRLSCDYPVLTHWRKANLDLASGVSKLVANAGSLESFAREVNAGNGPLLREWQAVNASMVRVRSLLDTALAQAQAGKPVRLPTEIAAPKIREPWRVRGLARKLAVTGAVLATLLVATAVLRPYLLRTTLLRWVDQAYTAWQMRNGALPDVLRIEEPPVPQR